MLLNSITTIYKRLPLCRPEKACHHLYGCCLSGSIRAKEPKNLTFFNMETKPFHSPFTIKGFADTVKDYHKFYLTILWVLLEGKTDVTSRHCLLPDLWYIDR